MRKGQIISSKEITFIEQKRQFLGSKAIYVYLSIVVLLIHILLLHFKKNC